MSNPAAQDQAGLEDATMMAQMVRSQIYAELDGIHDLTNKAKKMKRLVKLADEAGDTAAADTARTALTALIAAASA